MPVRLKFGAACGATLSILVFLVFACGAGRRTTIASGNDRDQGGSRVHVGPYGELSVERGAQANAAQGPRWLAGLRQGDTLVYRVQMPDGREQNVRVRVHRLVRRGHGVAARMEPRDAGIDQPETEGYWMAGDDSGLYRLRAHAALADPGFVPLDDKGRVTTEGRADARWRIPPEWETKIEGDSQQGKAIDQGWVVDELEMTLDGPVRGDSCARITKSDPGGFVRLVICANLGMVVLERGSRKEMADESWKLVAIEGGG